MADKGIIFSAAMVRALLDWRKTQTRRLMPQQVALRRMYAPIASGTRILNYAGEEEICRAPFSVGDRLYVREAYYQFGHWEPVDGQLTKGGRQKWAFVGDNPLIVFDAPEDNRLGRRHKDPSTPAWHKRLGRFMPRGLSRMWLAVTDVRVQRLQECSEVDAKAEGVVWQDPTEEDYRWARQEGIPVSDMEGVWTVPGMKAVGADVWGVDPQQAYHMLWNSLHTAEGERWQDNPWVVAVSFVVHQGNIDGPIEVRAPVTKLAPH